MSNWVYFRNDETTAYAYSLNEKTETGWYEVELFNWTTHTVVRTWTIIIGYTFNIVLRDNRPKEGGGTGLDVERILTFD